MTTKDFIYTKWFDTPPLNPKVGKPTDNKELHEPSNAFLSNMGRVEALGQLPFLLVLLGISKGHADVLAQHQGKSVDDVVRSLQEQPEYINSTVPAAKHLAGQAAGSTEATVQTGYQALVAAILLTSYGALENLIVDLWTVTVKLRPDLLDRLEDKRLKSHGIGRKNLKELRKIFEQMFPEEQNKPPHGLSKEFVSSYAGLLVLEASRNLFAHRCGIVDAKFLNQVKTSPALGGLKVGEELFVDFQIARALAGVGRDFGVYLIKFVDWWLNTHPPQ